MFKNLLDFPNFGAAHFPFVVPSSVSANEHHRGWMTSTVKMAMQVRQRQVAAWLCSNWEVYQQAGH